MKVLRITPSLESIKNHLSTILGMIVWLFVMILMAGAFLLMTLLMFLADNILEFYDYLFKRKFTSRPPSYLIQYYRIVRYGIKRLKKKLFGLRYTKDYKK